MVRPIINTNKKHSFSIELDSTVKTTGVILCDQTKMLYVGIRNATFVEKAPDNIIADVVDMVYSFIEM